MKTLKKKKWRRRKKEKEKKKKKRKKKESEKEKERDRDQIWASVCVKVGGVRIVVNNKKNVRIILFK